MGSEMCIRDRLPDRQGRVALRRRKQGRRPLRRRADDRCPALRGVRAPGRAWAERPDQGAHVLARLHGPPVQAQDHCFVRRHATMPAVRRRDHRADRQALLLRPVPPGRPSRIGDCCRSRHTPTGRVATVLRGPPHALTAQSAALPMVGAAFVLTPAGRRGPRSAATGSGWTRTCRRRRRRRGASRGSAGTSDDLSGSGRVRAR